MHACRFSPFSNGARGGFDLAGIFLGDAQKRARRDRDLVAASGARGAELQGGTDFRAVETARAYI
jgi:hypothetical protein